MIKRGERARKPPISSPSSESAVSSGSEGVTDGAQKVRSRQMQNVYIVQDCFLKTTGVKNGSDVKNV
jgi:hypothetical protein